ncbi:MAG: hypothetical protein C4315_03905 [Chloroflexota bacterium]
MAAGAFSGLFGAWIFLGKPDIPMMLNGVLAALAASTAACAYDVYLRRQESARRAREAAEVDLARMGLEVVSLTIHQGPRSAPGGPGEYEPQFSFAPSAT